MKTKHHRIKYTAILLFFHLIFIHKPFVIRQNNKKSFHYATDCCAENRKKTTRHGQSIKSHQLKIKRVNSRSCCPCRVDQEADSLKCISYLCQSRQSTRTLCIKNINIKNDIFYRFLVQMIRFVSLWFWYSLQPRVNHFYARHEMIIAFQWTFLHHRQDSI